jgi:hypothetical protein
MSIDQMDNTNNNPQDINPGFQKEGEVVEEKSPDNSQSEHRQSENGAENPSWFHQIWMKLTVLTRIRNPSLNLISMRWMNP